MNARLLLGGLLLAAAGVVQADDWQFTAPIAVTRTHGQRVFHHLESAGRKSIAVSDDIVAVTWEDNHEVQPRVYVAFKSRKAVAFTPEQRVSGAHAAYEPVVAALPGGRFLFAWEEDGGVWARTGDARTLDTPVQLARDADETSVTAHGAVVYAVWSQHQGRYSGIYCARLALSAGPLAAPVHGQPVDTAPLTGDQLYPSIAIALDGAPVVAWEDRRFGHTAIVSAHGDRVSRFTPPVQINETRRRGMPYGRGTGAMRVALARAGEHVVALWMDKRDFTAGYDVYAAVSDDGGRHFGKNEKVEDDFGDAYAQWHGALAADDVRHIVAVWDDDRDGNADLWMSQRTPDGWTDNLAVRGANGPGEQGSPAAAFDAHGDLHVVWLAKPSPDAPDRVEYMLIHPPHSAMP